ncbi:penicillin acylase family protein [Telmatospirillum siberiense]|uniref:Penicillin acylase family protein n=1 Tax=Telmatospirillum siberiense TaxID=382514 RepID=A0A2N3PQG4_9PROT|nr:penicillin acylase family protein [Telmatospirillum siberiense]PKU22637.1 penicillin acylase family protein [Telmatospirillum siberiense]
MRIRRWLTRFLLLLPVVIFLALGGIWLFLEGSLAQLDGRMEAAGLAEPVSVTRDDLGVPTISAGNRADLAYATGYLHAQDRFFQMDLLRRSAGGELAALFGPAALPIDRSRRPHRFRSRAGAVLASLPVDDRVLLERYAAGVNDGLAALRARPFEYALLLTAPAPWTPEDSLLVGWAMYFELQGNFGRDLSRAWLRAHATPEQVAFLLPTSSPWDAPLDAPAIDEPPPPVPPVAPDWYGRPVRRAAADIPGIDDAVGSNNWAVAGERSGHGGAIVADDMHLGLQLPNTWYRALLVFGDGTGGQSRLAGVTLPGLPALIAGSNGHVAWGFTNSYGDYFDLVELRTDPGGAPRYRTEDGSWASIERIEEKIAVKGGAEEILPVFETPLGPLWAIGGKSYAMRWIAHDPGAIDLGMMAFERALDLTTLLDAASRAGMPAQNMVAGDKAGHVGWTIAGPLPGRHWRPAEGFAYSSTEAGLGWQRHQSAADHPRVVDPPDGQIWTANARQLAGPAYQRLGDGGTDIGGRARQIRDDLTRLGRTDEAGLYAIGLDDRALFLAPWRDRALAALTDQAVADHPGRAEFRRLLLADRDLRADTESVGYRLVHDFLGKLYQQVFGSLDETLSHEFGPSAGSFRTANPRWAHALARLVDERPPGWLPQGADDWQALQLTAIDATIDALAKEGLPLAQARWGARNRARITHPFVRLMPALARWLAAPADLLPGDADMPRVAGPSFGQSERMVVSPGHEDRALFSMPGGESGHPLSPYFLAGHAAWVQGTPGSLLPGVPRHSLTFSPRP